VLVEEGKPRFAKFRILPDAFCADARRAPNEERIFSAEGVAEGEIRKSDHRPFLFPNS
jgi:hypothetical protein